MKNLYFLLLIFISCGNAENKLSNKTNANLNIQTTPIAMEKVIDTNFIDKNGLKQGLWIIKDTIYNFTKLRNYKDGLYEGIGKNYEKWPNHKPTSISFYSKNKIIWQVLPNYFENSNLKYTHVFNLKGFSIWADSVFVKVPYENGKTWFEGSYVRLNNYSMGLPTGELKSYYKNGKVKSIENWFFKKSIDENGRTGGSSNLNGKYIMYDSTGNVLLDTVFKMAPWILY